MPGGRLRAYPAARVVGPARWARGYRRMGIVVKWPPPSSLCQ
jgi:hypothetical protein